MEKTHELLANGKVFWANFELIASMNEEDLQPSGCLSLTTGLRL